MNSWPTGYQFKTHEAYSWRLRTNKRVSQKIRFLMGGIELSYVYDTKQQDYMQISKIGTKKTDKRQNLPSYCPKNVGKKYVIWPKPGTNFLKRSFSYRVLLSTQSCGTRMTIKAVAAMLVHLTKVHWNSCVREHQHGGYNVKWKRAMVVHLFGTASAQGTKIGNSLGLFRKGFNEWLSVSDSHTANIQTSW